MTIDSKEDVELSHVPIAEETSNIKDEHEKELQARGEDQEKTIQNFSLSRNNNPNQIQSATVKITANYVFKRNNKGGGKLVIDKDSLTGELVINSGGSSSGNNAADQNMLSLPLTIQKFKISKNFKKLSYKAATSTSEKSVSGKISGALRIQDTAILEGGNKGPQHAFSNLRQKKSKIKVKLGRAVYNVKSTSASLALTEAQ